MDLGIPGIQDAVVIGQGGSAFVYMGRQVKLERAVAIKVLKGSWDQPSKARFDAERRAMGRLSEDVGIVPIYEAAETANGDPYFIMPYYENGSLQTRMDKHGSIAWAEALAIIEVVSETISKAHAADIIHRDIKPANLLLDRVGRPHVGDFGIARIASDLGGEADSKHFTPAYSPPELFSSEGTSSPTIDVYGLAATLWSLLAGGPPFSRGGESNSVTLMSRVLNEPVGDLRHVVPAAICELLERAMSKQSKDRPQSVDQFLVELRRAKGLAATQPWKPGLSHGSGQPLSNPGSIESLNGEMPRAPTQRAGLSLEPGWDISTQGGESSAVTAIQAAEAANFSRSRIPLDGAPRTPGLANLPPLAGPRPAAGPQARGPWMLILALILALCVAFVVYLAGPSGGTQDREGSDAASTDSEAGLNPDPPQIRALPIPEVPEIVAVNASARVEDSVLFDTFASSQRRIHNGTGFGTPVSISTEVLDLTSNSAVVLLHSPSCVVARFSSEVGEYASAGFPSTTLCGNSHKQTFTNLVRGQKYTVEVTVVAERARAVKSRVEFKTAAGGAGGLVIKEIKLAKQGPELIGLSFVTSKCAVTQIVGSAGTFEEQGWPEPTPETCQTAHTYEVAGLEKNTLYDFSITAMDVDGNFVQVGYTAPTRVAAGERVSVINSGTKQLSDSTVEVFFETDSCASSTFLFENGEVVTFPKCKKMHSHTRSGLQPGNNYKADFIGRSETGQSNLETVTFTAPE